MTDDSRPATAPLDDLAAIEKALYRYAAALDERDPQALIDLWIPGRWTPEEADSIIAFHARYEYTAHYIVNHAYTIDGTEAVGTQRALVTFVRNRDGALTKFDLHVRYEDDRLVKLDGEWKFTKRQPVILFSTEEVPVRVGPPAGFHEGTL